MRFLTTCFLLIASLQLLFAATELTIAYEDKEQPPYYMGNSQDVLTANPGVAVEMIKMLEKKIPDLKVKFVRYPWKRCLAGLGKNSVDGIFNSSYKEDRLDVGWYPTVDKTHKGQPDTKRRLCTMTYSLYALKGVNIGWDGKKFNNPFFSSMPFQYLPTTSPLRLNDLKNSHLLNFFRLLWPFLFFFAGT